MQIAHAYEILSDEEQRKIYDQVCLYLTLNLPVRVQKWASDTGHLGSGISVREKPLMQLRCMNFLSQLN
jgi:curved DNA-binding protein CbpA